MSDVIEREKLQKFVVSLKYIQFIFLSVLFFGVAMLSYDLSLLIEDIVISPWSIGCSIFGLEGVIATSLIMRATEKKIKKLLEEEKLSEKK
ncbi:MAG: hypothetical protein ACTSRS_10085 [Candidatus Helarchaeota archaeon]